LKPESESSIEVRSSDDWAVEFKRFSADLDIFLIVLTSIGVTIAVLSIVNTMLMSVTERFIEFGILKANGWTNRNVLLLITFESALLGILGGLFGSGIGWIATLIVNANWHDRIHLYASPQLLIFGVVFSTVLGILGGLYPAIWASRMMPMDAIRRG
jgi:putative ABC transport system permease protein